jgi:uncharacterized membrane protein HdeD (DUF308 family)
VAPPGIRRHPAASTLRSPHLSCPEVTMATDLIHSAYRRAVWALVLRGVLALVIGIFILWRPMESVASFALVIALWAMFVGVVQIIHALELRSMLKHWGVLLISGLVSLAFGIAAIYYYPGLSIAFAVVWFTWWLFLTGILGIYAGLMEKRMGLSWGWTVAFGVLSILAAVFALMQPPITLAAIMGLIAGFAIVSGIVLLMGAYRLSAIKSAIA